MRCRDRFAVHSPKHCATRTESENTMTDDTKRPGRPDAAPANEQSELKGEQQASNDNAAGTGERRPSGEPAQVGNDINAEAAAAAAAAADMLQEAEDKVAPKDVEAEIQTLQAQIEDLTGRLLRAHAENQNLHRRLERERDETAKYAITKFARDIVAVADNFERAIASVPADHPAEDPILKGLLEGFTMTEREFLNVLERHKVARLSPKGEPFDPHRHQAMMEQEDKAVPAGTVLQVFQPGYVIEDRILRPALVVVSKGGPKAVKTPAPESAPATATEAPQAADASHASGPSPSDDTKRVPPEAHDASSKPADGEQR